MFGLKALCWSGPVAQLDRADGFSSSGRGFESLRLRHFTNVRPADMGKSLYLRHGSHVYPERVRDSLQRFLFWGGYIRTHVATDASYHKDCRIFRRTYSRQSQSFGQWVVAVADSFETLSGYPPPYAEHAPTPQAFSYLIIILDNSCHV